MSLVNFQYVCSVCPPNLRVLAPMFSSIKISKILHPKKSVLKCYVQIFASLHALSLQTELCSEFSAAHHVIISIPRSKLVETQPSQVCRKLFDLIDLQVE